MSKPRHSFRVRVLDAEFYILCVFQCTLNTKRKMAFGRCRPCKLGEFQPISLFLKWLFLSSHFLLANNYVIKCNFIKCWHNSQVFTSMHFEVKNCACIVWFSGCKCCLSVQLSRRCEPLHLTWAITPKGVNENFGCPALACISLFLSKGQLAVVVPQEGVFPAAYEKEDLLGRGLIRRQLVW